MEIEGQNDKEKQVFPIYPWDHRHRAAREAEEQPHKPFIASSGGTHWEK